jgi:hypothetical protein
MSKITYLQRYKDCTECGFDLTSMPAMKWFQMLVRYQLQYTNRKRDRAEGPGAFVWGFRDGHIVTGNDPLQGSYYIEGARDAEPGYCSYIGVTGTRAFVRKVRAYIRRHADYIKEESARREYI